MSNIQNHPQYQFLKDAGMNDKAISAYLSSELLGLRERKKDVKEPIKLYAPSTHVHKPPKVNNCSQKKEISSNPTTFKTEYLNFMGHRPQNKWEQQNIELLCLLINKIVSSHGIVQVLSLGKWEQIIDLLKNQSPLFKEYTYESLLNIYLEHLIEYQFYANGEKLNVKKGVQITKTLDKPLILKKGKLKQILTSKTKGIQYLDLDICVFEQGQYDLEMNQNNINLQALNKNCANQEVDIRIQHPLDYGFNINKLVNIGDHMTIGQFCDYQKHYQNQNYKKAKFNQKLKNGKIFFAVNFQPQHGQFLNQFEEHINHTFLGYKQHFDLLSYLDQEIPGCSSPQFYLKVKGCWTGGHQQNINMCAVNINHGPDPSEWYTVPYEQVQKVRSILNQKFKIDLYKNQGLWFQKINWFIDHGYKIKRILQKKGDIVISGPGTLHWVRSFGVALQSAWNIFPKSYKMFTTALHRHHQNYLIKFGKSNTIPLKSLMLKFVDHEYKTMDQKLLNLMLIHLQSWLKEEQKLMIQLSHSCGLGSENCIQHRLSDIDSFCQLCHQQTFLYYVQAWTGKGIACLECLEKDPIVQSKAGITIYHKYVPFQINSLFQMAKKRNTYSVQTIIMCNGDHIGKVIKCEMRQKILNMKREKPQQITEDIDDHDYAETNRKIKHLFSKLNDETYGVTPISKLLSFDLPGQRKIKTVQQCEVQTDQNWNTCSKCHQKYCGYEVKEKKAAAQQKQKEQKERQNNDSKKQQNREATRKNNKDNQTNDKSDNQNNYSDKNSSNYQKNQSSSRRNDDTRKGERTSNYSQNKQKYDSTKDSSYSYYNNNNNYNNGNYNYKSSYGDKNRNRDYKDNRNNDQYRQEKKDYKQERKDERSNTPVITDY